VVSGCQCFMAIGLRASHVLFKNEFCDFFRREISGEGQGAMKTPAAIRRDCVMIRITKMRRKSGQRS